MPMIFLPTASDNKKRLSGSELDSCIGIGETLHHRTKHHAATAHPLDAPPPHATETRANTGHAPRLPLDDFKLSR
jgi:hypothetical protein